VFRESAAGFVKRPKKRVGFNRRLTVLERSLNDEVLSSDTLIEFRNQSVGLRKIFAFLVVVPVR